MKRLILAIVALLLVTDVARAAVEIQKIETPGGVSAWLVEEHSIPFVALELRFKGGSSLDAPGKRGSVSLMTSLLEAGAGELDARAFAEQAETLASSFGFESFNDGISVSARFLTETQDASVALLRDALVNPRFDADAVERVRGQLLSVIRSDRTDPDKMASRSFNALTWADHPYATDSNGTEDSVAALTRADLLAAHAATLARDRVQVSAVGDITAEQLASLVDQLLGDLPATGAPLVGQARYALTPGLTVVDYETPQSVAVFGHEGIAFDDPDFMAAYVVNEIFGGGSESRLNNEVREQRGLTYGIGTWLSARPYGRMVMGRFASGNERMAEAVSVVKEEWAKIADAGVTEKELEDAKLYLTGAYPLRFDSNAAIADIMAGMQFNDQPADYIATRNEKIMALTLEDVNRVAKRVYRPDMLHFVVVGQPVGLDGAPAQN